MRLRPIDVWISVLEPNGEKSILTVQPRWLSIESAGAYIDKTYEGMRHTLHAHQKELPIVMIGGKPRIDIKDIDRLCMNLKR